MACRLYAGPQVGRAGHSLWDAGGKRGGRRGPWGLALVACCVSDWLLRAFAGSSAGDCLAGGERGWPWGALAGVHGRRGRSASPSRDARRNGRMRSGPERWAACASRPFLSYCHGCARVGLIPRACFSGVCGERELPGSCCVKGNGV